ncbi:Myosin-15 [Vitis vinifera]|uniref:Myosin-15 n=1 Tax=Vitis vinifera TaxID=29760 RepID=A0A438K883_VITVI|nr:Myosin-15 [Vitis vinifera]
MGDAVAHRKEVPGFTPVLTECMVLWGGFEQFCINFANEKLQQHFNEHVFKMEQEEYSKEEINWSYIEFIDNQDVLDLIEKHVSKINTQNIFDQAVSEFTDSPKVTYQTDTFLDKNRDYVVVEHCNLLSSSKCPFVAGLFPSMPEESSRSSYKFSSVGSRFKQQLQALMETLNSTEPHYIRCVKPNSLNRPQKFESQSILHQLRCGGVLEAVRISLAGYPTRRNYSEFVDRFGLLVPELMDGRNGNGAGHFGYPPRPAPNGTGYYFSKRVVVGQQMPDRIFDERTTTEKILLKLKLENFQLGKTKVFLRAGQIGVLDSRRAEVLDSAAKHIQGRFRTFIAHRDFVSIRAAAFALQAYCRGCHARNIYAAKRQAAAALLLQKYVRRWLLRNAYMQLYSASVLLQSSIRGFSIRQRFLYQKKHRAATRIQAQWRMCKVRSIFRNRQGSIIAIQCRWRQKLAKRELRKLKQEANEAGFLRLAKNKLEKQLEDLTWRLQLEKRLRVSNEEAKSVEISKLKKALGTLNLELDAAKLVTVNECNKNAVLQNQLDLSFKEKSALERELIGMTELRKENAFLKSSLESLEKKNSELEFELIKGQKDRKDTLEKLHEVEQKCLQFQQNLQSLEEKLSSLEDENHVLRQKALTPSPKSNHPGFVKSFSEKYTGPLALAQSDRKPVFESPTPTKLIVPFSHTLSESRRSKFAIERHPVGDENIALPYWLSNASALLCLLQRNLRSNGFLTTISQRSGGSSGITGRVAQAPKTVRLHAGKSARSPGGLPQQSQSSQWDSIIKFLDSLMDRLLGNHLFALAVHRNATVNEVWDSSLGQGGWNLRFSRDFNDWELNLIRDLLNMLRDFRISLEEDSVFWKGGVVRVLWEIVLALFGVQWVFPDSVKEFPYKGFQFLQQVPSFFIRKLITQVFSFINISLFNSLLLRRECCTFSNGEYVKSGLADLEKWIASVTEEFAGTSWHELNYIRQAVGFLVIHQKRKKSLEEIMQDLCPANFGTHPLGNSILWQALTVRQIYRISTMYWDDKYGTQSVSNEVVAQMRDMLNKDNQNLTSNSFLLDDDLSIPFSTEDIYMAIPPMDPSDVELPPFLSEHPSVQFLILHPK